MKRRIAALLFVLLAVFPLSGCRERTKEQILTKTIHDFKGYEVQNLDEQEDTNFVVYQKGVKQLAMSSTQNTPAVVDNERLRYTFTNASAELKAMQPGDVFWGIMPDGYQSLSIKVAEIEVTGGTVRIVGEECSVNDLFRYADIEMEIAASDMYIDESSIDEDVTLEWVPAQTDTAQGTGLSNGSSAQTVSLGAVSNGGQAEAQPLGKLTVPMELAATVRVNAGSANLSASVVGLHCEGSIEMRLHSVTIEWGYEPSKGYCYGSVRANESVTTNLEFEGEGYFGGFRKPLFKGYVAPPIPVVSSEVTPFAVVEAKGSIGGGFTTVNSGISGFGANASKKQGLQFYDLSQRNEPKNTLHFTEMEATITGGIEFRVTFSVCLAAHIYGSMFVGLELKGEYDPLEHDIASRPESIHDCEICIDGSLALLLRISVGAEVGLPGQPLYASEATIAEPRFDLGGFYISFGREGVGKAESGLGECPYKRWRTDVTVLNEDGSRADGAKLTAQYADGRSEETAATGGEATLYLPTGDNKLTAKADGQLGTAHAVVGEAPVEATIRLAEQRHLFLVWQNLDEGSMSLGTVGQTLGWFPDLVELFLQKYPDAILVDGREWNDGSLGYITGINESMIDAYDVAPGDIVVALTSRVPGMITRRWLHDGTLGGISSGSSVGMAPADLYVSVSIIESPNAWITEEYLAALSEEEREEALRRKKYEVREIRLCDFWTDLMLTDYYYEVLNAWGDKEEHCTEFSVRFVDDFMARIYDEDYQTKHIEGEDGQSIDDTRMLYEETIWHGDIAKGELFNEENGYAVQWSFARQLVPYTERAFDYIDMILENEWNSYVQLLPGGEMRLEDAP